MPPTVSEAFVCFKENCFQVKAPDQELDLFLLFHLLQDAKRITRSILFIGGTYSLVDVLPLGPMTKEVLNQQLHSLNAGATCQEGHQILLEVDLAWNFQSMYILADYAWNLIQKKHWELFDLDDLYPNVEWDTSLY